MSNRFRADLRPNFRLTLLAALVSFGSALSVSATEKVSYNYGSAAYFAGDDLQGANILASGQVRRNIRLTLDYRYADFDTDLSNVDVTTHTVFAGAGYLFRQLDWADVIVDAGGYFARLNLDAAGADINVNDGGVFTSVKARILPMNRVEIEPYVRYFHTLESNGDGFDYGLEGRFFFSNNVAIHGSVEESDFYDETVFSLGFRFGQQRDLQNY